MARPQNNYSNLLDLIRDLIWAQWNRLGLNGTGGVNCYSIDIESSIIALSYGSRLDGRLYEGGWGWFQRYGNLVNGQRLATLISESKDDWVARFLGAFLENIDPKQWKGVIKQCKKMFPANAHPVPLLMNSIDRSWADRDPILAKWGILYARTGPAKKMQGHDSILRQNALIRYRYLCGVVIRADVLSLLSVSHHCGVKREIDFLTTVRLADRLRCYTSTIHRIQKDLDVGGFIHPSETVKKNRSQMTTWVVKDLSLLQSAPGYDLGMIDWVRVNALLCAGIRLVIECAKIDNASLVKVRVHDFQTEAFHLLMDHGVKSIGPFGSAVGPLENYSVETLTSMVISALRRFYQMLCCVIMVRCRKCSTVFHSPVQGNIASMIETALINNTITCPHCKTRFLTSKPDFFYYDGLGTEQPLSFQGGFDG